ncbi:gustatory receptor 52 [Nasonia vitripennis]|uniref:Gustatory receptor n=1 Tax=Nasonia vitripennis TaxID=7425 RepID=A0A7M6USD1_NASVI|nr:gustatory receptor 52 [Nasonia vitripennis]
MVDIFVDMEKPFLPMLVSNWIFGIGIAQYPIGVPHRVLSFTYSLLNITLYCVVAFFAYPYYIKFIDVTKSTLTTMIFSFSISILLTIIMITSGWFQAKGVRKCIIKAAIVNYLMQQIMIPKESTVIFFKEFIKFLIPLTSIFLIITFNLFITFSESFAHIGQIGANFTMNYPIIVMFIIDSSFVNIIGKVKNYILILMYANFKFIKLNELLYSLLTSSADVPQHKRTFKEFIYKEKNSKFQYLKSIRKDYSDVIKCAKQIHLRLVELCQHASNTYGLHFLISTAFAIGIMIYNTYNIYNILASIVITSAEYNIHIMKPILYNCNWLTYNILKIVRLSWFCDSICKESVRSGDIASELYDEPFISENTKSEIRDFENELISNKLTLTAYGFFHLDFTLVHAMICTVATYLMIIIQVKSTCR